MLVELLTNQVKEKLLAVLALRLLCVLMAKYDWRVLFATEGGVRAVLACMQEYAPSALVQQAGLAVSAAHGGGGGCRGLGVGHARIVGGRGRGPGGQCRDPRGHWQPRGLGLGLALPALRPDRLPWPPRR